MTIQRLVGTSATTATATSTITPKASSRFFKLRHIIKAAKGDIDRKAPWKSPPRHCPCKARERQFHAGDHFYLAFPWNWSASILPCGILGALHCCPIYQPW